MSNPEQNVLDDIDALISEQLETGEPDTWFAEEDDEDCPHIGCEEYWHGLPVGSCPGSASEGPELPVRVMLARQAAADREARFQRRLLDVNRYLAEPRYQVERLQRAVAEGMYFGPVDYLCCFLAGEDLPEEDSSPWMIGFIGPYVRENRYCHNYNAWTHWYRTSVLNQPQPTSYSITLSTSVSAMNAAAEASGTALGYTRRITVPDGTPAMLSWGGGQNYLRFDLPKLGESQYRIDIERREPFGHDNEEDSE